MKDVLVILLAIALCPIWVPLVLTMAAVNFIVDMFVGVP